MAQGEATVKHRPPNLLSFTYYSFISVTTASSTWLQEEGGTWT
jgi:hypothetical protein